MVQTFAVSVVPACSRHKGINQVLKVLVGQSQISLGIHVEARRIQMDMQPATVVYFGIAEVEHPADLLQLFQSGFADQYRAEQLEGIVP